MKKGILLLTYVGFRTKNGARIVVEIWAGNYYAQEMRAKNQCAIVVENILDLYARRCVRKVTVILVWVFFFFNSKKNIRYAENLMVG